MMRAKLVVLSFAALGCLPAFAQNPRINHGMRGETIRVEAVRQGRENVDLWPLIVHPKSDAELRVNAALTRLNKEFVKSLRACDAGVVEFEKGAEEPQETKDDLTRSVEVTMRGPRFLSMVARDEFFCGGAHPDDDLTVLVFDLESGTQVDWSTLVAKSAGASSPENILGDAGGTRPLILPQLQLMYVAAEDADADCKGLFEDKQPIFLWPDAESGTLIAEVADFPHVAAPCKNELKLTIEQARKLGFDESLLLAIEEAHRVAVARPEAKPAQKQPSPAAASRPDSH